MSTNYYSVGNCVIKLQQQYYLYNPCNATRCLNQIPKNVERIINRMISINSSIANCLSSLYKVILTKNKEQIKIHSEQILHIINNDFYNEIKELIKEYGDIALPFYNLFNSWNIRWLLNKIQTGDPIEDIDYAIMFNFPFTEEDKKEQLDLREDLFNIYLDDIIDDECSDEIMETYGDLVEILELYNYSDK